jgi:hypothetical protein
MTCPYIIGSARHRHPNVPHPVHRKQDAASADSQLIAAGSERKRHRVVLPAAASWTLRPQRRTCKQNQKKNVSFHGVILSSPAEFVSPARSAVRLLEPAESVELESQYIQKYPERISF